MSGRLWRAAKRNAVLLFFLVSVVAIATAAPGFLRPENIMAIARQSAVHGIMAIGMTLVILTGGIDLSVGSLLALCGVLCATLEHQGWPVLPLVMVTVLAGGLFGLGNGLLITWGRIAPFIVTLGTMSIVRGTVFIATDTEPISRFGEAFRWMGTGELPIRLPGVGELARLPIPLLIFLGAALLLGLVLARTRFGRYLYAIGGNAEAARLSGIAVGWYTAAAYVVVGLATGLAAVVLTARLGSAESIAGVGYELDVIASVVIGGTSLSGGRGTVAGTVAGALLIGAIGNAMVLLGVSSHYQLVAKGAIIVLAAFLDRFRQDE